MRIHSDTLTQGDLNAARAAAGLGTDVFIDGLIRHGSRSRSHAFEVHLGAFAGRDYNGKARRASNSGRFGAADTKAATYDEWGLWIEQVFALDPDAIVGPYVTREGFRKFHGRKYAAKQAA